MTRELIARMYLFGLSVVDAGSVSRLSLQSYVYVFNRGEALVCSVIDKHSQLRIVRVVLMKNNVKANIIK